MKPTTEVKGGQRLEQRLRQMRERLAGSGGVYVGVPASAGQYEDGESLAVIGAVQEFGSADGRIPERSFLRVPLRANVETYRAILARGLADVAEGNASLYQVLSQVGARAAGDSQQAIAQGIQPANAQSTIERKGSSKPLVDTGRLRQSITYVVEGDE
jgi:hypothetical protein